MAAQQAPPSLGFSRQEHWSGLPFPSPVHECEKWKWSRSVVPDPQRPHGLQPTRLLRPWDFPGKSTGVGCHCPDLTWPSIMIISPTITVLQLQFPPQFSSVQSWTVQFSSVAQSCLTLCDPMGCNTPGLPVYHQLPELTQTHIHWVGDDIQPSHPLSSSSPPTSNLSQHQDLFKSSYCVKDRLDDILYDMGNKPSIL